MPQFSFANRANAAPAGDISAQLAPGISSLMQALNPKPENAESLARAGLFQAQTREAGVNEQLAQHKLDIISAAQNGVGGGGGDDPIMKDTMRAATLNTISPGIGDTWFKNLHPEPSTTQKLYNEADALPPGDPRRATFEGTAAKDALTTSKPGEIVTPTASLTGGPVFTPRLPEGAMPTMAPNGATLGVGTLPGAPGAIESSAASDALGKAHGDIIEVIDDAKLLPDGRPNPNYGSKLPKAKSDVLRGNGPPPSQPATTGPNALDLDAIYKGLAKQGNPVGTKTGGGFRSTISPSEESGIKTDNEAHDRVVQDNQPDVLNEKLQGLNEISRLGTTINTGPTATRLANIQAIASKYGVNLNLTGVNPDDPAQMMKLTNKLTGDLVKSFHGQAKVVEFDTSKASVPGIEMLPGALQKMVNYYRSQLLYGHRNGAFASQAGASGFGQAMQQHAANSWTPQQFEQSLNSIPTDRLFDLKVNQFLPGEVYGGKAR